MTLEDLNSTKDSESVKSGDEKDLFLLRLTEEMKNNISELDKYLTNLMEEKAIKINKIHLEKLDKLRAKSRSLSRIIGYLFDIQKIEQGRLSLIKNNYLLADIIKRIVANLKNDADSRGVSISTDLADLSCSCDKLRMEESLTTLVINAIDFSSKDAGKVDISLSQENENAKIIVKDNGTGITKENLQKIFEKFYQLDLSIDRDHAEAGFGLPVCKGIIEQHGGKIWAESRGWDTDGTEIHVSLPLSTKDESTLKKVE